MEKEAKGEGIPRRLSVVVQRIAWVLPESIVSVTSTGYVLNHAGHLIESHTYWLVDGKTRGRWEELQFPVRWNDTSREWLHKWMNETKYSH